MAKIGGFGSSGATTDWTEVSFEIPSGSQTLEWLYRKDGGTVKGRDAGWLDALVWTPVSPDPEISASLGDPESGAIPVSWTLADHGSGASSATLSVEWSTAPSFPNPQSATIGSFSAPQSGTFVLSGLSSRTTYYLRVRATNAAGGEAVTDVLSATTGDPAVGWFDVKWASDGYGTETAWWNAAAERTSGGAWTVPAGDASARSNSVLKLALPEGGDLRFTAVSPSAGGGFVTVDGTLSPVITPELPDIHSGAFAALCFARGGYKAWDGVQWVSLSGAAPAASDTPWTATFDLSSTPHRVRYAGGGATLSASGSAWIPLASAPDYVRGVGYAGGGSVGNFKASYASGGYVVPVLSTVEDGHVPLSFGKDASNAPTFEVTIRNAVKDAWYTVYAADTVDGTYKAVTSEKATADGLKTLSIPAPSSKPARFVRIGVSDAQISANTEL
jgi:hypothetical protein